MSRRRSISSSHQAKHARSAKWQGIELEQRTRWISSSASQATFANLSSRECPGAVELAGARLGSGRKVRTASSQLRQHRLDLRDAGPGGGMRCQKFGHTTAERHIHSLPQRHSLSRTEPRLDHQKQA